ncbi:oxidoreductase, short chain dehydrogenase/reductase family protein (macronuclear) [Tetrahymena thermophila SB210]|uniref:Oxidoreductase, short chain dehydrogenase/reductase family protein n=1 Tax=Tetrahymena thermophila (strain SB210) TaxID=312017 RepID=I7MFJ8_TETTS|nr:oxidoreductase, short chain dehydrogenase/reductase family protein [Tetrahymena thermophila SB210]EAS00238.2 oxidoreductase, short chain dehydrogenase/reductase family protein [Tetrahymena thermophila SB210]|eukprot:XP_001020483.2 oxidoreductase, short chain dehydrogenase/reductase family protein [Tetrahymena thermophila SB210]
MSYLMLTFTLIIAVLLIIRKKMKGVSCSVDRDMTGEVVVITGSNTGIGLETAKHLAKRNATIIMGCRDMQKAKQAVAQIMQETQNKAKIELFQLDLSDLDSIRTFVKSVKSKFDQITILINNAGLFGLIEKRVTKQNFEMIFGTNYIGTFYLTEQLLSLFKKENQNRILNVVSYIQKFDSPDYSFFDSNKKYEHIKAYFQSKYYLTLYSLYLNEQYQDSLNLKSVSIHPGVIDTEITRNLCSSIKIINIFLNSFLRYIYTFFIKTPIEGAQTTLHTALINFNQLAGGKYYKECKVEELKQITIKYAKETYNFTNDFLSKLKY